MSISTIIVGIIGLIVGFGLAYTIRIHKAQKEIDK